MQINKVAQRRKRHLAARQVSLFNHPYVLYENAPIVSFNSKQGYAVIAGEHQTGKTVALMQLAIDVAGNTPRAVKGKRTLIAIHSHSHAVDSLWCLLYSLMLYGLPGKELTGPRVSEMLLKQWLKHRKIDIVIGPSCMSNIDLTKYEVVHMLNDIASYAHQTKIRMSRIAPGVRASTVAKYKREQAVSYECSSHFLFASQIIIETSITGNDQIGHQVVGTVTRARALPSGYQFTVSFLPKKTNG